MKLLVPKIVCDSPFIVNEKSTLLNINTVSAWASGFLLVKSKNEQTS